MTTQPQQQEAHWRERLIARNERAATTAQGMGWTLISLMILTVGLVTLSILVPSTKATVDTIEKALILARVIVTVLYGHVVHSLRQASIKVTNELSTLRQEVPTLRQQVSTLRVQLERGQQTVDTLRGQLQEKEQEVSTLRLQVDSGQRALDSLHGHLNQQQAELTNEQTMVSSLKQALEAREREVSTLQQEVSSLQQEVSTLRVQVDSGHPQTVDSGHTSGHAAVDSGQQRVIHLDTKKRGQETSDQALGDQIRKLLHTEPGLSDRAMAARLSCSPTTVGRWRRIIEGECVNE